MLCKDCIQYLYKNLSQEAQQILTLLPCTKQEALNKANLTVSIGNRAFIELSICGFVEYKEFGRAKMYTLTKNGEKAKESPALGTLTWKNF